MDVSMQTIRTLCTEDMQRLQCVQPKKRKESIYRHKHYVCFFSVQPCNSIPRTCDRLAFALATLNKTPWTPPNLFLWIKNNQRAFDSYIVSAFTFLCRKQVGKCHEGFVFSMSTMRPHLWLRALGAGCTSAASYPTKAKLPMDETFCCNFLLPQ